jgi:hypothetical protein
VVRGSFETTEPIGDQPLAGVEFTLLWSRG